MCAFTAGEQRQHLLAKHAAQSTGSPAGEHKERSGMARFRTTTRESSHPPVALVRFRVAADCPFLRRLHETCQA